MVLNIKTRLMLAGAVLGASLLALTVADAQINPSTGAPVSPDNTQTQTTTGVPPPPGSTPTTQPSPYDTGLSDAGVGGSGTMTTYPSPFESTDAGFGGGLLPTPLGSDMLDAGLR
ncbi:MAG: hypothetical protein ACXU86_06570 [Archangium sp.]